MRRWQSCFSRLGVAVLLATWLVGADALAEGRQVLIIAHPTSALQSIGSEELLRIYLLRQSFWADGSPVIALNREANSTVRGLFTEQVLKQTASTLANHWQQMHFKGKTPPLVQESDQAVLAFVQKVPGAIGYVSADTPLGGQVKVLAKLP